MPMDDLSVGVIRNLKARVEAAESERDALKVALDESRRSLRELRQRNQVLEDRALRDPTGAYTRSFFIDRLGMELRASGRHGYPVSVALIEVVNLATINEQIGNDATDQLLCDLSALIARSVRREDLIARYAGRVFALLMSHTTADMASIPLRRVERGLEAVVPAHTNVILKVGVVDLVTGDENPGEVLEEAEIALLQAHQSPYGVVVMPRAT